MATVTSRTFTDFSFQPDSGVGGDLSPEASR